MSLNELREIAAEQEAEAPEVIDAAEPDQPAEDAPKADEYEFELSDDAESHDVKSKPTPEQALRHKLSKQRKRAQAAEGEADQLRARIAELEAENAKLAEAASRPTVAQQSAALPPRRPELYDAGIDGDRAKYDAASADYYAQLHQYQADKAAAIKAQESALVELERKREQLAARSIKLAAQSGYDADRLVDVVSSVNDQIDAAFGVDGAFVSLADAVGDGAEVLAPFLHAKRERMAELQQIIASDPTGIKAVAWLTRIAERAKPKPKTSAAPEPDQPLQGDGSAATAEGLQAEYDKASEAGDLKALREIKARARAAKIVLK